MSLESILSGTLTPLDHPGGAWRRWEFKNWNRHAAVLQVSGLGLATPAAFHAEIRERVSTSFRSSWWRGMAFGVVAETASMLPDAQALAEGLDSRDNRAGVWQWAVVASPTSGKVVGVHTWMQVWLTPLYEAVMAHYQDQGCEAARAGRAKDGLMKALTAISGLQGRRFPEYRPPQPPRE